MLNDGVAMVSVDDHIIEHPRVWSDRLPSRLREMGPRVVELGGGRQQWCYEGEVHSVTGPNAIATGISLSAGVDFSERSTEPVRFDAMRPGYFDARARLAEMDLDGVSAEVLFPNWARFAGTRFFYGKDRELALACVRAYNDFIVEEWQDVAPERYVPLMVLPIWDVELCLSEMRRCADKGLRGISFPDNPAMLGLASFRSRQWDRVFSFAEEAGLPLCMHFGTSGVAPRIADDAPIAAKNVLFGATLFDSMVDLVYSHVLIEHPSLKVVYSEAGIGWIPFALQRLDSTWEKYRHYKVEQTIEFHHRPSELVRRNVFACFIDDPLGIELRHQIGVDNIMWEADYPHGDSLFPHSRTNAAKVMANVPDDEVRRIVELNARHVFGLAGVA